MGQIFIPGFDIYSPCSIKRPNGSLRFYFGGWLTQADLPHDSIFLLDPGEPPVKVISPASAGIAQINDPTIVPIPARSGVPAYLIMYMTGAKTGNGQITDNAIYYSTSWADDGINWSSPTLLLSNAWLPSATIRYSHIELFANEIPSGAVTRWKLGTSGIVVGDKQKTNTAGSGWFLVNVDVRWRPESGIYQIVAERYLPDATSDIVYLDSADGINWRPYRASEPIITPAPGQFRIGTPNQNPDNSSIVYYGSTAQTDSMGFSIWEDQWFPQT